MLAWDTETRNFRWWENPAFLMSWDDGEGGHAAPLPGAYPRFSDHDALIAHNAKFDAHMTREAIGLDVLDGRWTVHDTAMMSRLVFGNRRPIHGLKELATDLIDPGATDAEKAMEAAYHDLTGRSSMAHDDAYWTVWNHDSYRPLVERYARKDAEYTHALYGLLAPHIEADPKLRSLYELETKVQTVLYRAEHRGITVDRGAVERLRTHHAAVEADAEVRMLNLLGGLPEGEGANEFLREALVKAGVPLKDVTEKTGELAVNRKALAAHQDHPAVQALFDWRRARKFSTTYLKPLLLTDVVHTNFKQAEAWTGRMACATPNLQNLPKRTEVSLDEDLRVRSVFVPREGMEFVVSDFEGIEMRVLAHFIGDRAYAHLIEKGDPHAFTAAAAFGGRPQDYYKGTPNRFLRDIAKHATFGIVYGGGGPVVAETINRMVREVGRPDLVVSLDQARGIRRKITDAIPGFKALTAAPWRGKSWPRGRIYEQLMASQDGEYGYVRTLYGRKQWINLEKAYVGLSGLVQGSAADLMKAAAVNLAEVLEPHGGYPLLFVHDEAVCEVPLGQGAELVPVIQDAMASAAPPGFIMPLAVESHVTDRSYAHAH